jgi:hypothetical protein
VNGLNGCSPVADPGDAAVRIVESPETTAARFNTFATTPRKKTSVVRSGGILFDQFTATSVDRTPCHLRPFRALK